MRERSDRRILPALLHTIPGQDPSRSLGMTGRCRFLAPMTLRCRRAPAAVRHPPRAPTPDRRRAAVARDPGPRHRHARGGRPSAAAGGWPGLDERRDRGGAGGVAGAAALELALAHAAGGGVPTVRSRRLTFHLWHSITSSRCVPWLWNALAEPSPPAGPSAWSRRAGHLEGGDEGHVDGDQGTLGRHASCCTQYGNTCATPVPSGAVMNMPNS